MVKYSYNLVLKGVCKPLHTLAEGCATLIKLGLPYACLALSLAWRYCAREGAKSHSLVLKMQELLVFDVETF